MINHYENFILLLWPDLKSYGVARKDICKKIAGSGDFSIYMEFSVSKKENYVNEKINLLWKLPDVFSISIDPYQYDWENKIHDSHLFFTNYTDGNNELKYECIILCKPMDGPSNKDVYLKEISKYSSSYDENLEKLKYAGTITSKIIKNEVNKDSIAYKISNSKIKIKYENISTQDFIVEIESNIENKFGQKPNLNLFAKKRQNISTDTCRFFRNFFLHALFHRHILINNQ